MITESDFVGDRRRVAYVSLGMLVAVNVMSQLDRQIMSVLIEPIRRDLALSDTQMGVITGLAFTVFYILAGLPLGRLADRTNRRNMIVAVLSFWSLMTAACGLARGYWTLFAARVGVGIGESGCAPAAQSILADTFPAERLGRALSTYQMAIPIGILIGLSGGGWLSDHFTWRQVFMIVGLPGLAVATLAFFVIREPARNPRDQPEPATVVLEDLLKIPTIRQLALALSIQTLTLAATATFNFTFMIRIHGLSGAEAGLITGVIVGVAGAFGTYLGGDLGDRLARRDPRWRIGCLGVGAVVSIPFSLTAYLSESLPVAIAGLTLGTIGSYMYAGAGHAVSQSLVTPRRRAMTAAAMLFVMNLFGYGGGTVVSGAISDAFGGEEGIRYSLAVMQIFLVWAGVHYALAMRTYRQDLAATMPGADAAG
ncbi:MAG: MFS transporter [Deltaproteobacteria bacterium]|nr:MFS transporter [Deltaproteobacteria bacterium]